MNRIVLNFKDFILNEKNREEESSSYSQINEDYSNSLYANLEEWISKELPDRIKKYNTTDEALIKKIINNSQNLIKDASKIFSSDEISSSVWEWVLGGAALIGFGIYAVKTKKLTGLKKFGRKFIDWFKRKSTDKTDDIVTQSKSAVVPKALKIGKRELKKRENLAIELIDKQNSPEFNDVLKEYLKNNNLVNSIIEPSQELQKELSFFVKNKNAIVGGSVGLTSLGIIVANHKSIIKSLSSQNPQDEDLRRMDALVSNPQSLLEVYKSKLEQSSSFNENLNIQFSEDELKNLKLDNYKIGYIVSWHIASSMVEYNSYLASASLKKSLEYSIQEGINQTQQG